MLQNTIFSTTLRLNLKTLLINKSLIYTEVTIDSESQVLHSLLGTMFTVSVVFFFISFLLLSVSMNRLLT